MRLLILSLIVLPTFLFSQSVNVGFKLGVNSNKPLVDSKLNPVEGANFGFCGGGFIRFKLGALFLQPEALYSQKVGDYNIAKAGSTIDTILHNDMRYIDIPVILGVRLFKIIDLGTGPVISLSKQNLTQWISGSQKIDLKNLDFKATQIEWTVSSHINIKRWLIGVRYQIGLSDLSSPITVSGINSNFNFGKNNFWQFTIGYKLFKTPSIL